MGELLALSEILRPLRSSRSSQNIRTLVAHESSLDTWFHVRLRADPRKTFENLWDTCFHVRVGAASLVVGTGGEIARTPQQGMNGEAGLQELVKI